MGEDGKLPSTHQNEPMTHCVVLLRHRQANAVCCARDENCRQLLLLLKWDADFPDSPDAFYQVDQGNLRPISLAFWLNLPEVVSCYSGLPCGSGSGGMLMMVSPCKKAMAACSWVSSSSTPGAGSGRGM